MQVTDEASLVDGCLTGDQESWNRLVDRYARLVWTVARSHGLAAADCEDVSQTTWMRVYQHLGKLRDPERLSAWITTTARRESLKQITRGKRHLPVGDGSVLDQPGDSLNYPEESALARERNGEVLRAFCGLDSRCQALLGLLALDPPPSYDEISATLGLARGSIGPIRARCLARFEQQLKRHARSRPDRSAEPPGSSTDTLGSLIQRLLPRTP